MDKKYYAFVSYASEDTKYAWELVGGLKSHGLYNVWYAPLSLKVGDKLLSSIEEGMQNSNSGILILSKSYLEKGWTNFELDYLFRQHIEKDKKLFPILHGITAEEVIKKHAGLGGIWALETGVGLLNVVKEIVERLGFNAPTVCYFAPYESPKFRFLRGRGELTINNEDGPAATLWELLITLSEDKYPVFIDGELFSKKHLIYEAAQVLAHNPRLAEKWVNKDGCKQIWEMCKQAGYDPKLFE